MKRGLPPLFLAAAWAGLLLDLPVNSPLLWFSVSSVVMVACSVLHYLSGRKSFSVEFLLSLAMLLEGVILASRFAWLKFLFFPLVISITPLYGLQTMMPLSILIPLLVWKPQFSGGALWDGVPFSACLMVTTVIASVIIGRVKGQREKARASLNAIKDSARTITLEAEMESLNNEEIMSHYFASVLKTDEEIRELLGTTKSAVFADTVNLFVPDGSGYSLRCSTAEKGEIIITGKGVISRCLSDKKTFSSADVNEGGTEAGYIKSGKVSSLVAVPIVDGVSPVGVLTVDSARYQAFSQTEQNTVKMFANHLARILERERIYLVIKRDVFGLKILKEESSNLVSSLKTDVIAEKLCEGAGKIAFSRVFFFLLEGERFSIMYPSQKGLDDRERFFDLRGTFLNMAAENRQTIYMSDVGDCRTPIMPFKSGDIRAVLVIPLLYENSLLGLFVMLSETRGFLDTYQVDMLKVICNQASTSIANAKLHERIERLATTDGLTGLFNHRLFQEKLSGEIRRINRFSEPVSLLLTDIDLFKKVNDTYGHPVGDQVLKGVAKVISGGIRDIDIPARYGGEEFAVILPGTDGKGAKYIAERLRKEVMETSFSADGKTFRVTISIGIATSPADARGKEELIERADQALYQAKRNGRNQCMLWTGVR